METIKKAESSGNHSHDTDRSKVQDQIGIDQLEKDTMAENNDNDLKDSQPQKDKIDEPEKSPEMVLTDKEDKDRPDPGTPLAPPQPDLQQE